MAKPVIALIDCDSLIFACASANEIRVDFDGSGETADAYNSDGAKAQLDGNIKEILDAIGAVKCVLALSNYEDQWRKIVLPSYKSHRNNMRRPQGLADLRAYVKANYACREYKSLEGDDILGMMLTSPDDPEFHKVCCSIDKDLRTIPGSHYNWRKPEQGIVEVTELEAVRFFFTQVLTGDPVDGYKGCPGIGKAKAKKILAYPKTPKAMWQEVRIAYANKGLKESVAIQQAQVAYIMRHGDYNFETNEVRLWTPP